MDLEENIKNVFDLIKTEGETYIVGGYLRDKKLGINHKDIDIITTCPVERLKELFNNLKWTEKGLSVGVCRMTKSGEKFEITSVGKNDIKEKLSMRDLTINSFYHNGEELLEQYNAGFDLKRKLLNSTPMFNKQLDESPQAIPRVFRFCSKLGFELTDKLIVDIKLHKDKLKNLNETRMTEESYEIIEGEHTLKALYYLMRTGLISDNDKIVKHKDKRIPFIGKSFKAKLIYLVFLIGKDSIKEFMDLMFIPESLLEGIEQHIKVFESNELPENRKKMPFTLLLKRYEFEDDFEKISDFLKKGK